MSIKLPAIKSRIGDWTYYTSTMTFEQVSQLVDRMDDEIYQSDSLKEALQRSITDNYLSIKKYILHQPEYFFNSLVLAIYDGNPNWIEVELEIEEETFYNLGFLTLDGNENIFPVDGQHRVEGIKAVLSSSEDYERFKNEKISVVFIGHKKTPEGMQRSRRLFNTLNRYAKPVSPTDIVILDEDDSSAIVTRYLIEDSESVNLFKEYRIDKSLQKAINPTNTNSFTSLIALNQCNEAIQKYYFDQFIKGTNDFDEYKSRYYPDDRALTYSKFQKYRPSDNVLSSIQDYNEQFWVEFQNSFEFIQDYLSADQQNAATAYRNNQNGGNILFRPIGILPFVQVVLHIAKNEPDKSLREVFEMFSIINFNLVEKPWRNTVWSPQDNTMIMAPRTFIRDMLVYLIDKNYLSVYALESLKIKYASYISFEGDIENIELEELLEQ